MSEVRMLITKHVIDVMNHQRMWFQKNNSYVILVAQELRVSYLVSQSCNLVKLRGRLATAGGTHQRTSPDCQIAVPCATGPFLKG